MASPNLNPPPGARVNTNHPLSRGLVGCWLMNEGGGGVLQNIAGPQTSNLTHTSNPKAGGGPYGAGMVFDGSGQKFSTSIVPAAVYPLTMCILARSSVWNNGVLFSIMNTTPWNGFYLEYTGGQFTAVAVQSASFNKAVGSTSAEVWHHVVGVYASSADRSLYIDGVLAGTNTTACTPAATPNEIAIGSYVAHWTGSASGARLYNRALSAHEARQLAAQPFAGVVPFRRSGRNSIAAAATVFRRTMMARTGSRGVII
tara:strand:- start:6654 stop:7424 length:771 start_codon:yes stop_codon:yes gene_type:complete